jgi:protein-S-isoprenylcysteine O-methyltransferase Ste14
MRAWVQHRRTGAWGILLFHDRRPIQLTRDFALVMIGLLLVAQAGRVASRPLPEAASGFPWAVGAVMAVVGLATMSVAQLQLGDAWRIGIEWSARPGLVTHGLYRWSRNPVFVGLLLAMLGYALVLPTAVSWAVILMAAVLVRGQVLEEERYLFTAYGSAFRDYARIVGRFVPGLGRLPAAYGRDA